MHCSRCRTDEKSNPHLANSSTSIRQQWPGIVYATYTKGIGVVYRSAGSGAMISSIGLASNFLHTMHLSFIFLIIFLPPMIHRLRLMNATSPSTPWCFLSMWWWRTRSSVKWCLSSKTGCFLSKGQVVCCSRPPTRSTPSSSKKGLNLWILDDGETLFPFLIVVKSSPKTSRWIICQRLISTFLAMFTVRSLKCRHLKITRAETIRDFALAI